MGTTFLHVFASTDPVTVTGGHMELFGVGPEMFADRMKAWIEAFGVVADTAIAKIGLIIAAILLLRQNLKAKTAIKEVKAEVTDRLDRQAARIHEVAVAAIPLNGNGSHKP